MTSAKPSDDSPFNLGGTDSAVVSGRLGSCFARPQPSALVRPNLTTPPTQVPVEGRALPLPPRPLANGRARRSLGAPVVGAPLLPDSFGSPSASSSGASMVGFFPRPSGRRAPYLPTELQDANAVQGPPSLLPRPRPHVGATPAFTG